MVPLPAWSANVPYQPRAVDCQEEHQESPAKGQLEGVEAKGQCEGPPKAPSEVLPHQVGGIAAERGCSLGIRPLGCQRITLPPLTCGQVGVGNI